MPPPPRSGDLTSHLELSVAHIDDAAHRMLYPFKPTKLEVRRPSPSEDMADFRSRR